MRKLKSLVVGLIMILIGSTSILAGCDPYRKLEVNFDQNEVVFYLSDNPEENIFSLSATVEGNKKKTSTDVSFNIHTTQGVIEQYGDIEKDGNTTTIKYRALSKGTVDVYVSTEEGNKTDKCTVDIRIPIKEIGFKQDRLIINRGTKKDFGSFVSHEPGNTSQTAVNFSVVSADVADEASQIQIDGTNVLVPDTTTLTSFTMAVASAEKPEISNEVIVEVVDTVNSITLEYYDTNPEAPTPYVELEKVNNEYNLTLAQNVDDSTLFEKLLYIHGTVDYGGTTIDKGFMGSTNEYEVRIMKYNASKASYSRVDLPYTGDFVQISKQLPNGAFKVSQLAKGQEKFKIVVDYAGHEGEFTTEAILNVIVKGLPTDINIKYSNTIVDTLTLFRPIEGASVQGISVDLEVIGVGGEELLDEPVIMSFESESGNEAKVNISNKYGEQLGDLSIPITVTKDSPLLLSHYYEAGDEIPDDIYMVFTSQNYTKVFTKIHLIFNMSDVASIDVPSQFRISSSEESKEFNVRYLDANGITTTFDNKLLNITIGNTSIIELDSMALLSEGKIVLKPKKTGRTTFSVATPSGVKSLVSNIVVFEELTDETTIKVFDTTLQPYSIDEEIKEIVVKTHGTYPIKYNINNKYTNLLTDMSSKITTVSSVFTIVDGAIVTSKSVGEGDVEVTLKGYNEDGELNKELKFKFKMIVKAPLVSATPNIYIETIYDKNDVLNYEDTLAKRNIRFTVTPSNASYTADDMTWIIKIGSTIIEPSSISTTTSNGNTVITSVFVYNGNKVYIETNPLDLKAATVYATLSSSNNSLVFNAICQIRQTFNNEKGIATTSVNEDVNITFTVLNPTKVSSIILNNVKQTSVRIDEDTTSIKNSYTFDTRDIEIDRDGTFVGGKNEFAVSYTILPANATIQELSVTHSQSVSDLEVTVDNVNKLIKIKVNRQIDGETIIHIRSNDSVGTNVVEQQLYLKVANGSYKNPFEIANADDFDRIRDSLTSHYVLVSDVNLQSLTDYEPIGTADTPFLGTLNGQNKIVLGDTVTFVQYSIYNLTLKRPKIPESENINYYGMFGYIGETGAVVNVKVNGLAIDINDSNSNEDVYVGAIAGFSKGLIYNCTVIDSSSIQRASVQQMFEDSTRTPGIKYKSMGASKYVYVGGIVGMLIGMKDITDTFSETLELISGATTSFQNNIAYMSIIATTTIPSGAIVAGGLVGYNLGAHMYSDSSAEYDSIVAINTHPSSAFNNEYSVYGGLVGTNFGTIENYTSKSFINGGNYVGGLAGANFGVVKSNTILPVIRGKDNVGGLIGFNYHTQALNLEPQSGAKDYQKAINKAMFPEIYIDGEKNAVFAMDDTIFYENIFELDSDNKVIPIANTLIKDNKVQFVDNANIHFEENKKTVGIYNTAIIGGKNVGGLIGASYDDDAFIQSSMSQTNYHISETIVNNSVYSYFVLSETARGILNYAPGSVDGNNSYYGDIISTYTKEKGNIGGLIGVANHANIIKAFVKVNVAFAANAFVQNIGGIVGNITGKNGHDGIFRVVDSHTSGIINNPNNPNAAIGAFIGDGSNIHDKSFEDHASVYYHSGTSIKFYNIQSSYSILQKKADLVVNFVSGFSGTNTQKPIPNGSIGAGGEYLPNDNSLGTHYYYDNLTAINSFYIGFKINYLDYYLEDTNSGMDLSTSLGSSEENYDKIKQLEFTYDNAVLGYHQFLNGDKFYYYNMENAGGNTIQYSNFNFNFGVYARKSGSVPGIPAPRVIDVKWTNVIITAVNSRYTFNTYYIEDENADEDGFGINPTKIDFGNGEENAIESVYTWYHNVYEYSNPVNPAEKYKAYNGLPIMMDLQDKKLVAGTPVKAYDNELRFIVDLPPMGIGVELKEDRNKTYIHDYNGGKELLLTITELDHKYYNTDGTLTAFNNYASSDKVNLSNEVKTNIEKENTYLLRDIIDITALPRFVGSSKLTYRSVYGLVEFGYDVTGSDTLKVLAAGRDQIEITSLYNTEVTYVVDINIISKLSNIKILQNKRATAEMPSMEVVKNVETSFFADVNSVYSRTINSRQYEFDLVQKQNIGTRYYFTYGIGTRLSVLFDSPMAGSVKMLYKLNGQSVTEEAVEVGGVTKYIRYVDITSSEVSVLGSEDFSEYSTILAVPYMVMDGENFFKVTIEDVENIAASYVAGATGAPGTFSRTHDLIKPLQIRIYNKTFSMQVDKTSLEFSAFIEPIINVSLTTDNFEENLYYIVSNGMYDSGEANVDDPAMSKVTNLGNLQVTAYDPDVSPEAIENRTKNYQFKFSVVKTDGYYNTINDTETFTVAFYTKDKNGNVEYVRTITISLLPQPVTNTSILHYPSSEYEEVIVDGIPTFIPKANEVAYDNIIPGYMGLLKINLSPYYANIHNVLIESSVVGASRIVFEQLIYDENEASGEFSYSTAYPQAQSTDKGIIALRRSRVGANGYVYDGNIYIRTILPTSVLTGTIFTISVTPYGYANGELVAYKTEKLALEAICPPGLNVRYRGSNFGVVARGTNNTITVTGDGLEGAYIDFDKYTTLNVYNGATEYGVSGKIKITQMTETEYSLSVATDVPQGSTIVLVGYTERYINDKLYTSRSELRLKVADFVVASISVENVYGGQYQSILNQTQLLRVVLDEVSYNPSIPGMAKKLKEFTESISTKLNSRNENATWYKRVFNLDGSFNDISLTDGDYGTFVIDMKDDGNMYIRNTVKNSADILVAKAIINYSFGTSPSIQLGDPNENTIANPIMDNSFIVELECQFSFNVSRNTDDDTPEPISTAEQFIGMEPGINYILTNDIVLTNYTPINTEIASLDGNGYVITIQDFDTAQDPENPATSINLGLFGTIADGTILKNIVVEIVPLGAPYIVEEVSGNTTQDMLVDVSGYDNINFGFIAAINNGIITNAQVVNDRLANEIRREREAMLDNYYDDSEYTAKTYTDVANRSISVVKVLGNSEVSSANVGGLVAQNNGYITNSRVENVTINGVGYVAGVAVRNNGTISSTYFKGANLLNQSAKYIDTAGTAGLVVFNGTNGTIQYCYTMAREGWGYSYDPDEDENLSNGKITYYGIDVNLGDISEYSFNIGASGTQESLAHRDITGISATEKQKFTGVYTAETLVVNDGTANVDIKANSELYKLALIALLNDSDMFTLRAVNSGINVDTDASGFVFENDGTISNSYSNILVNAAHSSGFVFRSGDDGIIEDCYSLSSIKVDSDAHSPFTGKTLENVESSTYNATVDNISYSHYLKINQSIKFTTPMPENKPYTIVMFDKFYDQGEPATNLEANEILSYNSFQGYAFNSDFELNVDILRSVWFIPSRINASSYNTYEVIKNNFKHSYYAPNRPELISANLRTMSVRVLLNDYETSASLQYDYLPSLIIGDSIRNPYLVYNAKTFNDYGTMSIKTNAGEVNKSYIRFISDINFDGSSVNSIKAETYNTAFAGDIDGNGMIVEDLKLIAESELEAVNEIKHLGLFGKLYSFSTRGNGGLLTQTFTAIVRNLNIEVTSIDGTGVTYVGALAGEMIDAYAFNIRVTADEGVFVNGSNAVGGVVGKISGNSELVNVATNISVSATNKTTLTNNLFAAYDGTEDTLENISYAGGVVGVVDVNGRNNDVKTAQKYARIRKIDVYGSTTISGDIAGGIFGYIGTNSIISDVHFTITNDGAANPRIVSKYSAGGLVGELRGKIERSYITHSNQEELNTEIKANMNTGTHTTTLNSAYTKLFNSSALADNYYMGGIAGMNIGGTISDSYTNVDVINGVSQFAGGVVGMNIGGTIKSVYTTGSVRATYVGGFIGLAVNGGLLEVRLAANSNYANTLIGEGLKISNIADLVTTKLELSSTIINSIVSANIWRDEDLTKAYYNNIGSFIGKVIDELGYNPEGSSPAIINTTSDTSRQTGEVNVFTNASKQVNGTIREIQEIGAANTDCQYSVSEDDYTTGHYGVVYKEESNEYYYYSRMKKYGSLRTIEEIVSRITSGTISKSYEKSDVNVALTAGEFVKYDITRNHKLPNIYKGWSAIYWEGTAVNNLGIANTDHVLPSLIARPNVSMVRVYDAEDLKLMATLVGSEFVLMNDIDLEGVEWNPVGTDSDPFTGSLHSDYDSSNNYNSWTIKNVSITGSDGDSVGFLGTISGATLNDFNLHIKEIAIDQEQYEMHVGGLVGLIKDDNESNISNIAVFGGLQADNAEFTAYKASGNDDYIERVGTSELNFVGTSDITCTNVLTMGGVIGTANQAKFHNLHSFNLHLEAKANEASTVHAGALGEDLSINAYGGVIGYFKNDKTITAENLSSKNIYIGNPDETVYQQNIYMGGIAGYGNTAYLRNIKATNFIIDENIKIESPAGDERNKNIYVGGLVGDFTGIVFDGIVYNDPTQSTLDFTLGKSAATSTALSNKINLKVTGSYNKTNLHIGGAFGSFTGLDVSYDDTPIFYGSTAVRPDNNPFGVDPGATGSYQVPSITNALVVENDITVYSDSVDSPRAYIGGVIGLGDGALFNVVSYGDMDITLGGESYVAGLAGQLRNDFVQNVYINRDITFNDRQTSRHSNMLYIAGAIGYTENIGDLAAETMNRESNNIVSTGLVDIETSYYSTLYAGGLIARAKNITLNSSISNTNITVGSKNILDRDDGGDNLAYVGGFVGSFEQESMAGAKATAIRNSYCTGSIALATDAYQNGGAGGFVGYVNVETENKEIYNGGAITENSANIKNCYSISRIIPYDGADSAIMNNVKSNIINDNATIGGFVGTMADSDNILTNCFFNKEIFTTTENSTNDLVTRRYSGAAVIDRNFGIGLSLNDMLYTQSAMFISALSGEPVRKIKPENGTFNVADPVDPSGMTALEMWHFENNSYPTLKFYHESITTEVATLDNPDVKIPKILEYLYTNQFFGYKIYEEEVRAEYTPEELLALEGQLSKYNITYLLNGKNVEKEYTITYYREDGQIVLESYNTEENVSYSCTSVKDLTNTYGIQSKGTEQNPTVINGETIDLEASRIELINGVSTTVFDYDLTNKAVIIQNVSVMKNKYMNDSSAMINGTILFRDSSLGNINGLKFKEIDTHSFIYGMTTNANTGSLFTTVNGELKNMSIMDLEGVYFVDTNYGLISNSEINASFMTSGLVNTNYGTIYAVKFVTDTALDGNLKFTEVNNGVIDEVQLELKSTKAEFVENEFQVSNDTTNGIIHNYMLRVEYGTDVAYKYYGTNASSYWAFNTADDDSITTYKIVFDSAYRTYITNINNTRAHAIDVFTNNGVYLSEDAVWVSQARDNIPYYDFANDWVILTGQNNNMPILRSMLRDNHYDKDIGADYYFTPTEVTPSSGVYNVDNGSKLAYVGKLISEATTGSFTINLTADIDLNSKLWIPIDVASEVTVKLQGNGFTISNISVITSNEDAGLFGTSEGTVRVYDLLMKDGYVADVAAYAVTDNNNAISKIGYDFRNTFGSDSYRNYGVGAVIGRAYNTNGATTSVALNRVGNQYVYVAGYSEATSDVYDRNIGGLIGVASGGSAGILDCYVNSPFMHSGSFGSGIANGASNIRITNTYAANYDLDTYGSTSDTKYVTNYITNSTAIAPDAFADDSNNYLTGINNYYLAQENTVEVANIKMGATLHKLRTHTLPLFDWTADWVRVQEDNDGLPYNLFEVGYWIQEGYTSTVTADDISESSNTITVKTAKGLANIAYKSHNGTTFAGKTIVLNDNLDMAGKAWSPIGYTTSFEGVFDGNGKTISNLSITQFFGYNGTVITPASDNNYIGFIAKSNNATIKNLTIANARVSGNENVGAIVANATDTTIDSCIVDANTTVVGLKYVGGIVGNHIWDTTNDHRMIATISQTDNSAEVGGYQYVGGIVGKVDNAVVQMCTNNGKVYNAGNSNVVTAGDTGYIGGIVGYSAGYIYETINNAEVHGYDAVFAPSEVSSVGGIAGHVTNGQIINALNNGLVNGTTSTSTGLIVGSISANYAGVLVMTYSDATKQIAGADDANRLYIGTSDVTGNQIGATSVLQETDFIYTDSSVWSRVSGVLTLNNKIPADYKEEHVVSNAFTITNVDGYNYLNYMIHRRADYTYEGGTDLFNVTVNTGTTYEVTNSYTDGSGKYVFQGELKSSSSSDKAVFKVSNHSAISNYHGGLLGVIKNATITRIEIQTNGSSFGNASYEYQGMLAGISQGNSKLSYIYINTTATLNGLNYVGGIIGKLSANDEIAYSTVTAINLTGTNYIGGFVGLAESAKITGTAAATHTSGANITATAYMGGIAGKIDATTIEKVGFIGSISSSNADWVDAGGISGQAYNSSVITECSTSGTINLSGQTIGGVVGYLNNSSVTSCTVSSDIIGKDYIGGIVGSGSGYTVTGNTYSGTVKGYTHLGGIAGHQESSTITGNTMNGNIYVYRTDDDNGKKSQGINSFNFGYSVSHSGDGNVSSSNGSQVEFGVIDIAKFREDNKINFVYGDDSSIVDNTVSNASRITFQDNFVKYTLSISTDKNTNGTIHLAWYEYHVTGTFTVSASRYEEISVDKNGARYDGTSKGSTSKSASVDGSDSGVWSIGASWGDAYSDFEGKISNCSYDFTDTW